MGRLVSIGPEIWIAEGGRIKFLTMNLTTRATLVRLRNGSLWFHSPVQYEEELAREIADLGPPRFIIAPNTYHHLYIGQWQKRFPRAKLLAAPGLSSKRPDLRYHGDLGPETEWRWKGEIKQIQFAGNRAFDEYIFFHVPSKTAILTDLIVNIRAEEQSAIGRLMARFEGVTFPNGKTPLTYRLLMKNRSLGAAAIRNLIDLTPSKAIISHGEWFREDASSELMKRLSWLRL